MTWRFPSRDKGNGPIKFLIPVSLHEVRLWSRILVGPFPNNISTHLYILDEIDLDSVIGNGPTLTILHQEYVWNNPIEGNGPNKFLIYSTCNKVIDCEWRI